MEWFGCLPFEACEILILVACCRVLSIDVVEEKSCCLAMFAFVRFDLCLLDELDDLLYIGCWWRRFIRFIKLMIDWMIIIIVSVDVIYIN